MTLVNASFALITKHCCRTKQHETQTEFIHFITFSLALDVDFKTLEQRLMQSFYSSNVFKADFFVLFPLRKKKVTEYLMTYWKSLRRKLKQTDKPKSFLIPRFPS